MENIPIKVDGVDVLPADQWNQVPTEIENAILSTGITLSSGDLFQLGKTIANYAANGDFYTDSGAADAYVLGAIGSKQAPTTYSNGTRVRFLVGNTNTGASTVNVATLGVKDIKRQGGAALSASDMVAGEIVKLEYDGTDFILNKDILEIGAIRDISRNLVIENNSGNPNFQIDIAADEIMLQNSVGIAKRISSVSETIDITVVGANGRDAGSEASSTWYFVFAIAKADGTQAGLLSASSTAPTMPSGYTFKALEGAVRNDSGSNFIPFRQVDNEVFYDAVQTIKDGTFTTAAWTAQSITALAPPTAKIVHTVFGITNASGIGLSPRSDGHAGSYFRAGNSGASSDMGGVFPTARENWGDDSIRYEDTIYYFADNANSTVVMNGWEY